jgi:tRNA threonylcarbamoyladenosine dehydratase
MRIMKDTAWLGRTKLLVGQEGLDALAAAHVVVVGLGGVGSFAAEFIARSGVGQMTIVDGDVVDPSNRNRQLPALANTHGKSKALLMEQRLLEINPELQLTTINQFLRPEDMETLLNTSGISYVMDCIDSVTPKLTLIKLALDLGLPIVSSMGAGGKTDPTKVTCADIFDTKNCYLSKTIRKRLRWMGIVTGLPVVYSTEEVQTESLMLTDGSNFKKSAYGTVSYMPAAFGGVCASVVIRHLLGEHIPEVYKSATQLAKIKKIQVERKLRG